MAPTIATNAMGLYPIEVEREVRRMEEPKFSVGDKIKSKSGVIGTVMVMGLDASLVEKIDGQTEEFKNSDLEKVE